MCDAATLTNALAFSCLDYCNVSAQKFEQNKCQKLQCDQNNLVKIFFKIDFIYPSFCNVIYISTDIIRKTYDLLKAKLIYGNVRCCWILVFFSCPLYGSACWSLSYNVDLMP